MGYLRSILVVALALSAPTGAAATLIVTDAGQLGARLTAGGSASGTTLVPSTTDSAAVTEVNQFATYDIDYQVTASSFTFSGEVVAGQKDSSAWLHQIDFGAFGLPELGIGRPVLFSTSGPTLVRLDVTDFQSTSFVGSFGVLDLVDLATGLAIFELAVLGNGPVMFEQVLDGDYELRFELSAEGNIQNPAGGFTRLSFDLREVPEPSTGVLIIIGLIPLLSSRRGCSR